LKLIFLDCGLVSRLSERDQQNFVDLFRAVAKGDGRGFLSFISLFLSKTLSESLEFKIKKK